MSNILQFDSSYPAYIDRSRLAHQADSRHHKITGLVIGILATLLLAGAIYCSIYGMQSGNLAISVPGFILVVASLAIGIKSISSLSKGFSQFVAPPLPNWSEYLAQTITQDTIGNVSDNDYRKLMLMRTSDQLRTVLFNDPRSLNHINLWETNEIESVLGRRRIINLFQQQPDELSRILSEMEQRESVAAVLRVLCESYAAQNPIPEQLETLLAQSMNQGKFNIFGLLTFFPRVENLHNILSRNFFEKLEVLDIKWIRTELARIVDLIGRCPNIHSISIPHYATFDWLPALQQFPNLINFDLSDRIQFDSTWLENFPQPERVRSLNLSGCVLTRLEPLVRFSNLAELNISRTTTNSENILATLNNLRGLRVLRATNCNWLNGATLANLPPTLQLLDLSDCRNVDPNQLPNLPELTTLLLERTPVQNLDWLTKTPQLQKLVLSMTPLPGNSLSNLVHVPQLRELLLLGCVLLNENSMIHISRIGQLRVLDIRFCEWLLNNENGLNAINNHGSLQVVRVLKAHERLDQRLTLHESTIKDLRIADLALGVTIQNRGDPGFSYRGQFDQMSSLFNGLWPHLTESRT